MKDGARGGADTLEGGDGDDWLYGDGREQATAGAGGADKLYGGDGPDHLIGGSGNDLLAGGAGADWFVFASGSGADEIIDFVSGADNIDTSEEHRCGEGGVRNGEIWWVTYTLKKKKNETK